MIQEVVHFEYTRENRKTEKKWWGTLLSGWQNLETGSSSATWNEEYFLSEKRKMYI